jgi:hypothetical protein
MPELRCMMKECTSQPLTDIQVARHATDQALELYFEKRQKYREAIVYADAMSLVAQAGANKNAAATKRRGDREGVQRKAEKEANRKLREKQLRAAMPNALMCPRCKCGPIEHFACGDLAAHHSQQVAGGCTIDNRCPNEKCRFFSAHVIDWSKWDGVLREEDDLLEVQQPNQDAGAPVGARLSASAAQARGLPTFVPRALSGRPSESGSSLRPALRPAPFPRVDERMNGTPNQDSRVPRFQYQAPDPRMPRPAGLPPHLVNFDTQNQASVDIYAQDLTELRVCEFLISVTKCEPSQAIHAVASARRQLGSCLIDAQELFDSASITLRAIMRQTVEARAQASSTRASFLLGMARFQSHAVN